MALVAADYLETTVYCYFQDQVGLTKFHHQVSTNPGNVTEAGLAQGLADYWQLPFNSAMTSGAQFRGVALRNYKNFPANFSPIPFYFPPKVPGSGTAGSTPLPRQVSGLISFQSTLGGRSGKGRRYIPFPDQASNEAGGQGSPTAAYLGLLRNIATATLGNVSLTISGSIITLQPRHQTFNPLPAPGAYVYYPIDINRTKTVDGWATQRRRGTFGRTNVDPFL